MVYLLLAIASSAMVSIVMRLSTHRVKQNVGMLAVNYFVCTLVAAVYAGFGALLPDSPALPQTLGLGAVHGALRSFPDPAAAWRRLLRCDGEGL